MSWVDTYALDDLAQLHSYIDFVVCLGGDGLLLHAASLFGSALPPIISFKLGSLGFLTTHRCLGVGWGGCGTDGGDGVGVGRQWGRRRACTLAMACNPPAAGCRGIEAGWLHAPTHHPSTITLQLHLLPAPTAERGQCLPHPHPPLSTHLPPLPPTTFRSYADFRRHLHNVVNGCRELESCQLISAEDGRSLLGVYITLRMRLECEVWRCAGGQGAKRRRDAGAAGRPACSHPCAGQCILLQPAATRPGPPTPNSTAFPPHAHAHPPTHPSATHPPTARRDGEALPGERFEVLNEVVLSRGHNPYLSKIEVSGLGVGRRRWVGHERQAAGAQGRAGEGCCLPTHPPIPSPPAANSV